MTFDKFGISRHEFRRRLADDDEIQNHRLLCALVGQKIVFARTLDIAASQPCSFQHVADEIFGPIHSNRPSLRQNLIPEFGRQIAGGEQIDRHP
jgi:hypothetical protein